MNKEQNMTATTHFAKAAGKIAAGSLVAFMGTGCMILQGFCAAFGEKISDGDRNETASIARNGFGQIGTGFSHFGKGFGKLIR